MHRFLQELWLFFSAHWSRPQMHLGWIGAPPQQQPDILPLFPDLGKKKKDAVVGHIPLRPADMNGSLEWDHLNLVSISYSDNGLGTLAPALSPVDRFLDIEFEAYEPVHQTPVGKRILDLALCLPFLLFLGPLLAFIAVLIKIQDGGPVFFKSIRVGRNGVPFDFYKFRTMVVKAETMKSSLLSQNVHGKGITFKIKQDPRITPVGRFLRRWSLDELPQLWNVLIGDMSLVGPRPAVPEEVSRYSRSDRERLKVLPGLTCIWQISGRSEIPFEGQVEMDREYIQNQSFLLDFKILFFTVPAIIRGKGAY